MWGGLAALGARGAIRGRMRSARPQSGAMPNYQEFSRNLGFGLGGKSGAIGNMEVPTMGYGDMPMTDPMLSSVSARRQRLAGMMRGSGTGMLPDKGA